MIYAVEVSFVPNYVHLEGVKRHLIFIECDRCERRVKPGSEELEDWTKGGTIVDGRSGDVWYRCGDCA